MMRAEPPMRGSYVNRKCDAHRPTLTTDHFTSICDVAQTFEMRKEQTFAPAAGTRVSRL